LFNVFDDFSKVNVAEDFYISEEIHSNCSMDATQDYKACDIIDGFLTCSNTECGDFALRCICHSVTDMGG